MEALADNVTKEHGRIEWRRYELYDATWLLRKWKGWPIQRIVKVTRYREEKGKIPTLTESHYVTNGTLPLKVLAKVIREHWFIENKLHYVKDEVFREDFTRKRINPYPFAICIDIVLNVLKVKGVTNIRPTFIKNSLNFDKFLSEYSWYL